MISTGNGDPEGVSYGTYQLASALGNADRFVQKYYPQEFKGLKGGRMLESLIPFHLSSFVTSVVE
jgi:hypothetical protein